MMSCLASSDVRPRLLDTHQHSRKIHDISLNLNWKRTPSAMSAIFGLDLPYRPPKNAWAAFLWRRRMWLETTFGLSTLEPWEKLMMLLIFYLLLILVLTGVFTILPQQVVRMHQRTNYYFFGHDVQLTALSQDPASWRRNFSTDL